MFHKNKFTLVEKKQEKTMYSAKSVKWVKYVIIVALGVFALLLILVNVKDKSYYQNRKTDTGENFQARSIILMDTMPNSAMDCTIRNCKVTCTGDVTGVKTFLEGKKSCTSIELRIEDGYFSDDRLQSNWLKGSFNLSFIGITRSTLTKIDDESFNHKTVAYVKEIDLRGVTVSNLTSKTFIGLDRLETFTLVNKVETFFAEEFLNPMSRTLKKIVIKHVTSVATDPAPWLYGDNFRELLSIVFDGSNFGGYINAATFEHLRELSILSMDNCQINYISDGAFDFMMSQIVVYISLRNNKLKYLSGNYLFRTNSLRRIDIEKNPWDCTCKLEDLVTAYKKNAQYFSYASCATPSKFAGKNISEVNIENCDDEFTSPRATETTFKSSANPITTTDLTFRTSSISSTSTKSLSTERPTKFPITVSEPVVTSTDFTKSTSHIAITTFNPSTTTSITPRKTTDSTISYFTEDTYKTPDHPHTTSMSTSSTSPLRSSTVLEQTVASTAETDFTKLTMYTSITTEESLISPSSKTPEQAVTSTVETIFTKSTSHMAITTAESFFNPPSTTSFVTPRTTALYLTEDLNMTPDPTDRTPISTKSTSPSISSTVLEQTAASTAETVSTKLTVHTSITGEESSFIPSSQTGISTSTNPEITYYDSNEDTTMTQKTTPSPQNRTTTVTANMISIECQRHSADLLKIISRQSFYLEVSPPDIYFKILHISETTAQLTLGNTFEDLAVIWFYDQPNLDYSGKSTRIAGEFKVGCQSELEDSLIIEGLESKTMYTFCIVKESINVISPFNCRSYYTNSIASPSNSESDVWLKCQDKPLTIGLFSLGALSALCIGLGGMYIFLRSYPALLKGSKRVIIIKRSKGEVLVMPRTGNRSTLNGSSFQNSFKKKTTTMDQRRFSDTSTQSGLSYIMANNYESIEYRWKMNVVNDMIYANRVPRSPPPPLPKRISESTTISKNTADKIKEPTVYDYGYISKN